MNNNLFDMKSFKDFLENNMNFIESFFENNNIDENFLENIKNMKNDSQSDNKDQLKTRSIPVDIIKKSNEILCIFEIPGLNSKEDVSIQFLGSTLIIEGELSRKYQSNTREISNYQRNIGNFSKKVNLPYVVDTHRINAKYKSGLLEVRLPIIKAHSSDNIDINFYRD